MKIVTLILLLITTLTQGQITKDNWLVGVSGNFNANKNYGLDRGESKTTYLSVNTNTGYFFIDKLAAGLNFKVIRASQKIPYPNGTDFKTNSIQFGIGPFVRYYYLDSEKKINLFNDLNFKYISAVSKGSNNNSTNSQIEYGINAGAVFFLNTTIGFEVSIGYLHNGDNKIDAKSNSLQLNIGFQLHLERDNEK